MLINNKRKDNDMYDKQIEKILELDPSNLRFNISMIASKSAIGAVLGSDDCCGMKLEEGCFYNNLLVSVIIHRDKMQEFLAHSSKWKFKPRKNDKYVTATLYIR